MIFLRKVIRRANRLYKIYIKKDEKSLAHKKWVLDKGDETLRLNYELSSNSVVFDLGGFKGDFASQIVERYGCHVHVFEPVHRYYEIIKDRFKNNDKVIVNNFGLSSDELLLDINIQDDGSSVLLKKNSSGETEKIKLKKIDEYLHKENIDYIELIKINIEGGEFDLLDYMIENNIHKCIDNIQVQFHDFVVDAPKRRNIIREKLEFSHLITYDYYFIWENWSLKK